MEPGFWIPIVSGIPDFNSFLAQTVFRKSCALVLKCNENDYLCLSNLLFAGDQMRTLNSPLFEMTSPDVAARHT